MAPTIKLAEYLFQRLRQLGVDAMHGVPGDYNLTLLDYVEPAGLQWVGNANELNAAYAADAYARMKGVGALITTFGVGELSAMNAIAGAYAERAAVVHIVGTPNRSTQDGRVNVHHTFNDGEYRRFGRMHSHIVVAQAELRDPRTAPQQIDQVLQQCLIHSRPVYFEVPVDCVDVPVETDRLQTPVRIPDAVPNPIHETVLSQILERIYSARQPIIMVDGETRALGITDDVRGFVASTKWPTFTSPFGKGLIDETLPNFHGIFQGKYGDPKVKQFFDESDLVVSFGPHFSSTNTYAFSSIPKQETMIAVTDTEVRIGSRIFRDIPARLVTPRLLEKLDSSKTQAYKSYPELPRDYLVASKDLVSDGLITQDKLWRYLANFLQPGDVVMGETGSAAYGCRDMVLPQHARYFTAVTWLSIGYMLPAAQGAGLAQRELIAAAKYNNVQQGRTVLMIGDGSFQMTVQELGTIIRLKLDMVLFLINNDGYTIERCIHGLNQRYNDVSRWQYLQAPGFFGATEKVYTASVKTWGELDKVLGSEELNKSKGLRMVEIHVGREDFVPGQLLDMLHAQKRGEQPLKG